MGGRRAKSELERYVGGMNGRLRLQKARRPETWLGWAGTPILIYAGATQNLAVLLAVPLTFGVGGYLLHRRRLGGGTAHEIVAKGFAERTIERTHRDLKKGDFDARVGPEARAILDACAHSAFAVIGEAAEAHVAFGGKPVVMEAFHPLSRILDELMRAALVRTEEATMMHRLPNDEALTDLRAIRTRLATLHDEAEVLAREFRPRTPLPEVPHLAAEREAARRELDHGA